MGASSECSRRASRFSLPAMLLGDFLVQFTPLWLLPLRAVCVGKAALFGSEVKQHETWRYKTLKSKSFFF